MTGKLIAEVGDDGNIKTEYIYLQELLVAVIQSPATSKKTNDKTKLDDKQAEAVGDWKTKKADGTFKGRHQIAQGDSGATMTWRQTLQAGVYKVHARWQAGKHKSPRATYNINGKTITVNQTKSGKKWQLLRKMEVTDNQEVVVILEDTGGKVSADGIRFKKTAETVIEGDERQLYFAHSDHLNTPTKLTNTNGKIVWQAQYSPFGLGQINGDVDADGTAVTFNIRFAGQYFDQESGLHYNWHRYYDPAIGRYIQSDPTGLDDGLNKYGYVHQNPVNFYDPNGEAAVGAVGVCFMWPVGTVGCGFVAIGAVWAVNYGVDGTFDALTNKSSSQCSKDDDGDNEKCKRLRKRAENLRKEIYNKRIPALESNPGSLPEYIGPGEKFRDTIRGHRTLLTIKLAQLRKIEAQIVAECGGK